MGREFVELFEDWAHSYDSTVGGHDEEYKEVFAGYDQILKAVTQLSGKTVLEFGVGTGNLTNELLNRGKKVFGIEPSKTMREKAAEKLGSTVHISDGDFLTFPVPEEQIETIVSTYAFHHLTDEEKEKAVRIYSSLLGKGGKIVFADTVFTDQKAYQAMIEKSKKQHFLNLANDLESEYYTTHSVMRRIFESNSFEVTFTQMNEFVWLMKAVKQ
ncbi:class I SAM-dependent methyltransferase [Bacillus sp. V2I10]|uniref:class I SAM-dependent methyltransferase n=1 Tax=Bacillus sp. V2I10 TaxID=3042276 RepID=UPI0027812B2A|nr:class I SAM-dependent methyltransferase [Bacillus sp. V2I10]MDQ0858287.1 putative AdoMet-dependent methyltransferase [Bacillus sp. V2I10]